MHAKSLKRAWSKFDMNLIVYLIAVIIVENKAMNVKHYLLTFITSNI